MPNRIDQKSPQSSPPNRRPASRRRAWLARAAFIVSAAAATAAGVALPAAANNWRYRDNNIRTFTHYDYNAWRHGYWWHGNRLGRFGWWWYAGGYWYPYAKPIYPFPNPYIPPTVIIQPVPPPPPPGPPQLPPPTNVWYYCPDPQGYYPYVPQCRTGWQAFPATPQ